MGSILKLVFAVFLLLQLLDFSRGSRIYDTNEKSWCVASSQASPSDLQKALDYACGQGQADCSPIQPGHECFDPNTLVSHASFAFNNYYQKNGAKAEACNFGGTAKIVSSDPSYDKCKYD